MSKTAASGAASTECGFADGAPGRKCRRRHLGEKEKAQKEKGRADHSLDHPGAYCAGGWGCAAVSDALI